MNEAAAQTPVPGSTVFGHRPSAPHRVWYGVSEIGEQPDYYPGMTINTGGKASAHALELQGVSTLNWAYGSQTPWRYGPDYWEQRLSVERRTYAPDENHDYSFVLPGIAMDEFANAVYPEVWSWIQDGLREGRAQNPEVFVAAWLSNTVRPEIFEMGRNGTIDLFMVQGYTHTKDQGNGVYWSDAIARMEAFAERGLGHKAVLTIGHITDYPNWKGGEEWDEDRMRRMMAEVKRRFPNSPGISFFQAGAEDPQEFQRIAQMADRISQEFWPDNWIPDAVYSLTPQSGAKLRLEADDDSGTPHLWTSRFPEVATDQMWRFTNVGDDRYLIQPVESNGLALEATADGVRLVANTRGEQQQWILTPTNGSFALSPASMPNLFLEAPTTNDGASLRLVSELSGSTQLWALNPEFSPTEYVPPVYHAENAQFGGGTKQAYNHPGSVRGFVDQSADGGTLTFADVEGGEGGLAELVFRYANGDANPRLQLVTINDETFSITFPSTGGWGTWENLTFEALLESGATNTIILTTIGNDGPNIDKLTAISVPEPGVVAGVAIGFLTLLARRPARGLTTA